VLEPSITIDPVKAAWLGVVLAAVVGAPLAALVGAVDGALLLPLLEQALKATAPIIASTAIGLILVMVTYSILLNAAVLGPRGPSRGHSLPV
jgi:hypothetical protein